MMHDGGTLFSKILPDVADHITASLKETYYMSNYIVVNIDTKGKYDCERILIQDGL